MRTHPMLLFVALIALFAPTVPAQSGAFQIAFHGKPVGEAKFHVSSTGQGRSSNTSVRFTAQTVTYAISKTEQLSAARQLLQADLSAVVNGQAVHATAIADSAKITLAISANGRTTTTPLDARPWAVLLPDFDPGALDALLELAAAHNGRDLWVILPKQAGSIEPVQMATYPDEKGTLNGKPIPVHHLVASYAGAKTDLFSGPENHLLQAELPQPGFALVRKGFVLKPPAKPLAPPDEPATQN